MSLLRKIEYKEFLETPFWKELSAQKKVEAGSVCEACGAENNLHSHHKFYRKSWFATKMSDLIVLCGDCHVKHHKILTKIQSLPKYRRQGPLKRKRIHKKIKYQNYSSNCFSKRECSIQIRY